MVYRTTLILVCFSLILACPAFGKRGVETIKGAETIVTYDMDGQKVNVFVSSVPKATDLEGRLRDKTVFDFLKFTHKKNFYSFNLPSGIYQKLTKKQREDLVIYLIGLYDRAFEAFKDIFGYVPEDYQFSVTFGKTKNEYPFNYVYLATKTSNIFPNFLPYDSGQQIMTAHERKTMFHEIGHSMFGIIIGSMRHPRTRAFEEGFVDYFAEETTGEKMVRSEIITIRITPEQSKRMKGLTQPDIDASIWSEEIALEPSIARGYIGVTHHVFGLEFLHAFVTVFGKESIPEFYSRLRQIEDETPVGDFGTGQVRDVLVKMGHADAEIKRFEKELHKRLKENVFSPR